VLHLKKVDRIFDSSHVFRRPKFIPELFNWSDATPRQPKTILRICHSSRDYIRIQSAIIQSLAPSTTFPSFSERTNFMSPESSQDHSGIQRLTALLVTEVVSLI